MRKLRILVFSMLFFLSSLWLDVPVVKAEDTFDITVTSYFDTDNQIAMEPFTASFGERLSIHPHEISGYTFAFWIVNHTVRHELPRDHEFVLTRATDFIA